jgi:AraC-like DNA-binding protein
MTMGTIAVTKYQVKHPVLKVLIKYIWVMHSERRVIINHKLLPVGNVDIIINCSAPIKYRSERNSEIVPERFHFSGIRNQYHIIQQAGYLEVIGIAFFPAGLYPLVKMPLAEFTDRTVGLDAIFKKFTARLEDRLHETTAITAKLNFLEAELFRLIDVRLIPTRENFQIFNTFDANPDNLQIRHFCEEYGINERRLERMFHQYIGVGPKLFQRIRRFQRALGKVVAGPNTVLSAIAHENEYFDQTHFINDFKTFAGVTPSQFLKEKSSVREILKDT